MAKAAGGIKNEKFETQIRRVSNNSVFVETDTLAIEEPLEIRLGFIENGKQTHKAVSITMRTPGNDFALAAGFLFTEGILENKSQINSIKHCGKFPNNQNTVRIDLNENTEINFKRLERNFYTTSSCGVCGKSSLEALFVSGAKKIEQKETVKISHETIHELPRKLQENQNCVRRNGWSSRRRSF